MSQLAPHPDEPVTLESVEAWLRSLPADQVVYTHQDPDCGCVTACYLRAQGVAFEWVAYYFWIDRDGASHPLDRPLRLSVIEWTSEALKRETDLTAADALALLDRMSGGAA